MRKTHAITCNFHTRDPDTSTTHQMKSSISEEKSGKKGWWWFILALSINKTVFVLLWSYLPYKPLIPESRLHNLQLCIGKGVL
jgi:hypothetical protein